MATHNRVIHRDQAVLSVLVRAPVVALTLLTAAIHASLGGALFTANAIGYSALALLMVLPGPVGQARWLIRLALLGFTAMTVGGWLLFGARYEVAYIDKGIELVLIGFLGLEVWLMDGGPVEEARRVGHLLHRLVAIALHRRAA